MKKLTAVFLTLAIFAAIALIPASAAIHTAPREASEIFHEAVDNEPGLKDLIPLCLLGVEEEPDPDEQSGGTVNVYRILVFSENPHEEEGSFYILRFIDDIRCGAYLSAQNMVQVDSQAVRSLLREELARGTFTPLA